MDSSQLAHIESLCHSLYLGTSSIDRANAQQQLLTLSSSMEYIPQCQHILNHSALSYAQLLAANSLEILVTNYWNNFNLLQKYEIKNYLLNYLFNGGVMASGGGSTNGSAASAASQQMEYDYVIASLIKLLCRVIKLGWFDGIMSSNGPENTPTPATGGGGNIAPSPGGYAQLLQDITQFLHHEEINYRIIGIKIFVALVNEMNIPITGKTLTQHRKVAVSFRDNLLYEIFTIGITTLRQQQQQQHSQQQQQRASLCHHSLSLILQCLSFDFIGTNTEESSEDVGTIQVPSSWRPIIQDLTILELLFHIYHTQTDTSSPTSRSTSSLALEAIVQLSSIRRSLFTTELERQTFLNYLMIQIHDIMSTKHGLDDEDNYHEFCRLLGRLKASYQLSELIKTRNFNEWLMLAADFTMKSLLNWQYSMNSIHYLLALWSRLVAALPYLRHDSGGVGGAAGLYPGAGVGGSSTSGANSSSSATASSSILEVQNILKQCVLSVIEAYVQTMLSSVEVIEEANGGDGGGDVDNPLDDEGTLKEQMDKLPTMIRLQYETIAQFLLTMLQSDLQMYENIINQSASGGGGSGGGMSLSMEYQRQLRILDGRLTWLTHIIAAVIGSGSSGGNGGGGNPSSGLMMSDGKSDQLFDGQLARSVFLLIQMVSYRLDAVAGPAAAAGGRGRGGAAADQGRCSEHLEVAFLRFFQAFKRSYLMDPLGGSGLSSPLGMGIGGGMMTASSTVPGGESAHPLLSLALSYGADHGMANDSSSLTIFDVMNLGDTTSIMNMIVNKICSNIRHWNHSHSLLDITLDLFVDLISTYASSKTLLSLDMIQFMIHNHSATTLPTNSNPNSTRSEATAAFPFLSYDNDNKYRISFYTALTRLVFTAAEDLNNSFDLFMSPKLQILTQFLSLSPSEMMMSVARVGIICLCRDMRGIAAATTSKRTYNLLFDALYPNFFIFLKNATEVWCADPPVMTAVLKFLQEFVFNKSQRIFFEQSSANGILLFRETSAILCSYGSRILEIPVSQDIYAEKYKGIRLMLNVLTCALSGGYVNFGVFALYEDKALQNALDVSLQMCLQIPLDDILTYMKLSKAYFGFLEVLMKGHLDVLCGLDSNVFITLIKTLHEGLQSSDAAVCALCATAIDHLFTYIFLNQRRDKPTIQMIREHLTVEPDLPDQLMATLFNTLLFATQANHWAITRPILSLMLSFESSFGTYRDSLLQNQPMENQQKLMEEFEKLTGDIQTSVETSNRDRFTQKLTLFRLNVRQFLAF